MTKHVFAFDTETHLIRPTRMAPELVCLTYALEPKVPNEGGSFAGGILHWSDAEKDFAGWLADPTTEIVGHNVAFDMGVMGAQFPKLIPLIFQAYEDNRVTDTMLRAKMLDISNGCYRGKSDAEGVWRKYGYSLADVSRRLRVGPMLQKDGWRLRYGDFRSLPITSWEAKAIELQAHAVSLLQREEHKPEKSRWYDGYEAKDLQAIVKDHPRQVIQYAVDDARSTLAVYRWQEQYTEALVDQYRQARGAFALHLSSVWGLRTSAAGVEALRTQAEKVLEDIKNRLVVAGLVRKDGTRDTKAAARHMKEVCERESLPLRKTEKGGTCLDFDACMVTEDDLLQDYAEFTGIGKTINADYPMLFKGTEHPIHCHYDLADTSRTTCSKPNIQNLRKALGIRECFIPRAGSCFIQADFPQLELFTLAQVCYDRLGYSALGEALKKGIDPHTEFASRLAGCTYEEGVKLNQDQDPQFYKMRQVSKAFNFGKPGGLGPAKLVALAASAAYNVTITETEARNYGRKWLQTWPEMAEYFALVNGSMTADGTTTVFIPQSNWIRGGARYCAACNTPFQGLGAACAKNAMWRVSQKQYTDFASALFGTRTVAFVHDEIIAECPEEFCHDAALALAKTMVDAANEFLPNVPIQHSRMKPLAMRFWSKEAKPTYEKGRLIPWQ